ncbi:MAG TPA: hypothetical protein VGV38_10475 [Pyrinomonadaceae bacterium]|nr:hypothetical protein [Pyrinomonadaceae bacterium]
MSTDDRLTEIINYLSAMSRDVGELRRDVTGLRQELNEFRGETNERLERLEARVAAVETRAERIESRTDRMDSRLERLEAKVDKGFEETRDDIRLLKHAMEVYTEDAMELRVEQRSAISGRGSKHSNATRA